MNATEIQTLEVARELALKKITDSRVNRFSSGTKLIFSRVDVTLTRDNVDVTKDFNLYLEYLEEEGEICVKCFSQKSKNQYDVVFFYISGDDAISRDRKRILSNYKSDLESSKRRKEMTNLQVYSLDNSSP